MSTRTKYGLGPDVPAARPSLSEAGKSPLLRVRISRELHASVRHAAEAAGTSVGMGPSGAREGDPGGPAEAKPRARVPVGDKPGRHR